ncbi:MAG: sigma factor-like helix-turn-helix DNA-binding protein [Gemmataceae bacterium]
MNEPRALVEHFFRHEFGRLVAVLTRTLCGFSTAEIARALLTTDTNIQKRIERARDRLRELDVNFDTPAAAQLGARLDAVLAVVYLLFSQGCHVAHGDLPIRRDSPLQVILLDEKREFEIQSDERRKLLGLTLWQIDRLGGEDGTLLLQKFRSVAMVRPFLTR